MPAQAPGSYPPPGESVRQQRDPARTLLLRARRQAAQRAYARPLAASRPAPAKPRLRLVGSVGPDATQPAPPPPIDDPADPRWVLALRTAEQLEGDILPPDRRENLLRMARMFGLTVFDANLIIAIVQDQARRGHLAIHGLAAGEPQLRMIPKPVIPPWWSTLTTPRMQVILLAAGLLTAEVLMLWWLL